MVGLFEVDDDGGLTLRGGRSRSSGLAHFPLSPVCPYTGADDVEPVPLPRRGTLWAWTTVTTAPPGYAGPVPYGLGVVELTWGEPGDAAPLRVVGRLAVAHHDDLAFGDPMQVVAEELPGADGEPTTVWAFAPAEPTP
jgi:uncharacterized OB-fold protein